MRFFPAMRNFRFPRLRFNFLGLAGVLWLGCLSPAFGQLVLNIDPAREVLWFTGSDEGEGIPIDIMGIQYFGEQWGYPIEDETDPYNLESLNIPFTALAPSIAIPPDFYQQHLILSVSGVEEDLYFNSFRPEGQSIGWTGTGQHLDYSAFSTENKAWLASLDGDLLLYNTTPFPGGSGFSPVTISVVPEPSTYAALAGATALGLTALQRRRRRRSTATVST